MSKYSQFRDSITGLFTSKKHAQANPGTTQGIAPKKAAPLPRTVYAKQRAESINALRVGTLCLHRRIEKLDRALYVGDVHAEQVDISDGLAVKVSYEVIER